MVGNIRIDLCSGKCIDQVNIVDLFRIALISVVISGVVLPNADVLTGFEILIC